MERQSPADMQAVKTIDAHTYTTPTTVTMATTSCSDSTLCTQAPLASLSILPSDQQAVRVIQHTIHRPQSMAAQYLHHMYAAQQQHLMLQTAALQQSQYQHKPQLQSLATIPQASVCQRQLSSPSSTDGMVPPAGVSQTSITLPASSVTAHLIGRSQTSNSTAAATVSQQAMLLGNRPANCNQAQMYLRTQMLILTPAAPVAAVHSELPAFTSCSTLPTSSEVHNLSLHAHLPGALAAANSVVLKPTPQTQVPFSAASVSKTSVCAVKTNRMIDETDHPGPRTLNTSLSPVHTHTLEKKPLSCPSGQQVAHHQLILQQATAGALNHKRLHPIALKVAPQEPNCQPLSLSIKRLTTPSTQTQTNTDPQVSSAPLSSSSSPSVTTATTSSAQNSIPAATVQSQPPPLVAAPKRQSSILQAQNQPPPPPPPLVLHRLPPNPPASLQRFSLHSVHALAVQTEQRLRTEQELSIAEALNLMPYQNLPPPQTVAVDLKVHLVGRRESSSMTFSEIQAAQESKAKRLSPEETKEGSLISPQKDKTPEAVIVPSKQNGEEKHSASTTSSQSVIKIPQVEKSASLTTISHHPPPSSSPPLPMSAPPTAVRSPPQITSAPTSLPGSPDRMCTSSVLTHLIEGFVIREGLEPFPVNSSSLSEEQQASLPEPQDIHTNRSPAAEDSPVDADLSESSDSEMENGGPPAEELGDEAEAALLQCEYCGGRGYAQTFLRSQRFCSMTCVRRFNVSCTKRVTRLRAGRWSSRPLGRRGRPPSRMNVAFLRRAQGSYPPVRSQQCSERDEELQEVQEEEEQEDEHPAPMKTRLQKLTEREQERESERVMPETISVSDGEDDDGLPSQWNVEQVFSYIYSLPGGSVVAEEFRSQEIDGQALLLLTEDHLVSTMNLKLGPALKLCAQIQSLKDV